MTKKMVYYSGYGIFCILDKDELHKITTKGKESAFFVLPEEFNTSIKYRGHCTTSYLYPIDGEYDVFLLSSDEKFTEAEINKATRAFKSKVNKEHGNTIVNEQKQQIVLKAAIELINDNPDGIRTKSSNRLIAAKIAEKLDDLEHKYFSNKKSPFSIKKTSEIISKFLKNSLIK